MFVHDFFLESHRLLPFNTQQQHTGARTHTHSKHPSPQCKTRRSDQLQSKRYKNTKVFPQSNRSITITIRFKGPTSVSKQQQHNITHRLNVAAWRRRRRGFGPSRKLCRLQRSSAPSGELIGGQDNGRGAGRGRLLLEPVGGSWR